MVLLGHTMYPEGALHLRVAHQQALLIRYCGWQWANFQSRFFGTPEALLQQKTELERASLQASLDAADSAAMPLALGVATWRVSGLQLSSLLSHLQHAIQILPFNGTGLFSDNAGPRLQNLKGSRVTLLSLSMHTLVIQCRRFRPQSLLLPYALTRSGHGQRAWLTRSWPSVRTPKEPELGAF